LYKIRYGEGGRTTTRMKKDEDEDEDEDEVVRMAGARLSLG
jgi:hypothetical protein